MKKKQIFVLALAVLFILCLAPSSFAADNPFRDVKSDAYYYDAVLWAADSNVTSGTSSTTFSPGATCTRGQIVTFLWRSNGQPEPASAKCPFKDVKAGAYYYKAVLWAVERNITAGTSATTFSPDAGCTRGQVVTFLHRAKGSPSSSSASNPFSDVKSGSYYYNAVLWAVDNKITSGTSATAFSPSSTCTRGQIVTFLYRAVQQADPTAADYDAFGMAISSLVKENPVKNWSAAAAADNDYYSGRLIVQASSPVDFTKFKPTKLISGPDHLYIVQFASSKDTEKVFKALANMSEIVYVEPDGYFGSGDSQTAAAEPKSWGVKAIGADRLAAHVRTAANNSITVAVVDTGVSNHSFLEGRILSGGYDYVDNDRTPADMNSHGTHVAGTVVDCTPGIKVYILPIRVLDETGSGYASAVGAGIRYAADHGAKVINLSLGGAHSNYIDGAIQYAMNKGVCVVAAAGNEYGNTADFCPAHISKAIVVGAVDTNRQKADFSNIGASLDIVCPGVGIVSCVPGGSYKSYSGTSMAAPHAAASVAMLRLLNPSKSPAEIEAMLRSHTIDLGASGWDTRFGAGLPDLKQFVPAPVIQPSGISLNKGNLSLITGDTATLVATVSPANAANKTVTWSSSNSSVAAVSSNGAVTAKAAGTATITAKTVNGLSVTCKVTVSAVSVSSISIASRPTKTTYIVGQNLDTTGLKLKVTYNNGTTATVSTGYSCSPTSFSSAGTKTITVSYKNHTTSFDVTVNSASVQPDGIGLNKGWLSMIVGDSETLIASVSPENASNKTITWSSSNTSVASVSSSGTVKAIDAGTATITAKTVNGLSVTCQVTVSAVSISGISISSMPHKTSYYIGESLNTSGLELKVTFNNGTTTTVSSNYSCSPTSFSSAGTWTITVRYMNHTTSFDVTVNSPGISLSSYSTYLEKNCWDSKWNLAREVPLWIIDLPSVTTYPSGGDVSWSIVSGQAYLTSEYIAAQQPGRIIARATYTYLGYTYSADYVVDLRIYKTTTGVNYLNSDPWRGTTRVATVPTGATVWITEVRWDASVQASEGRYYLWGRTTYNGYSGWIVIS